MTRRSAASNGAAAAGAAAVKAAAQDPAASPVTAAPVLHPVGVTRHPQQPAAPLSPAGVAALLRLAVVSVDPDGRISYWNRGAEELFGHRWEAVFGHRAAGLLSIPASTPAPPVPPALPASPTARPESEPTSTAPRDTPPPSEPLSPEPAAPEPPAVAATGSQRDVFDLLDDLTRASWAGTFPVADRDGKLHEALWWSYRIVEPAGRSMLVLAAGAKPLRSGALRIAIGDRMLRYALMGAPGPAGIRIVPRLGPVTAPGGAADSAAPDPTVLAARLGAVLPRVSAGRLERTMRQVSLLGYPALEVEGAAPLPVLPYEAAQPQEPSAAQEPEGARSDPHTTAELLPAPRNTAPVHRRDTPGTPVTPSTAPESPAPFALSGVDADFDAQSVAARAADFAPATPGQLVQQQLALLRETGARVGTTLELDTTAAELCQVAVPRFADFATVLIVDDIFADPSADADPEVSKAVELLREDGSSSGMFEQAALTVRRIAVANRRAGSPWEGAMPEGELFTLPAGRFRGLTEPLLLSVVDPSLADDLADDLGVPALGQLLPRHSLLLTPLTARGIVLGRMCFVREPQRRPFDAKDTATAVELAARGAVHLDNARLHLLESRAATILQRSMLPTSPPRIPGVRIAHHYRPGDRQAQVGGDWFDAIQLPGGRVALVVGDVMGHGLLSAAVMGQFRTAVQTMAALDLPPAQLLRHLDNLAHRLGADHLATCVYAVYDAIHRTLTLANAGHIPPVLARHDGRSELLRIPEGAPIGVGGIPFETVEIPVPDGSWLVLCTDGLVEVRGQGIDAGLAALCSNVIEPQHTPEDVCNQILSRVHSEDRRDDVALLVARFEGIASQDVAEWRLNLDASEVRTARAVTRGQLATWGLGQLSDLAELLVSELVTNALRVASNEVRLRLMRVGKLLVEVYDDDHNLPQLRRADQDDEDGRGLALVSNLSPRWGTSRRAVGKVVWFELSLPNV